MSAPAIKATFSDFKLIRGRKIAQLVFEVPIEGADQALETLGGVPNPAKEAWVGIARINPSKTAEKPANEALAQDNEPKERRRFADLSYPQQIGIRCNDPVFAQFVKERPDGTDDTASYVRERCGVDSRSKIIKGTEQGKRWEWIDSAFQAWKAA